MRTVSLSLRIKTILIPLRINTERCRREEGHNLYNWNADCLLVDFSGKKHENIVNFKLKHLCVFIFRVLSTFLNQSAPSQNMFVRAPKKQLFVSSITVFEMKAFG